MSGDTKACLHCLKHFSKPSHVTPSKWTVRQYCSRSCAAIVRGRNPIYRAKLSENIRRRMACPEYRERHIAAARRNIAGAHLAADRIGANARRAQIAYGWCPENRRDDYRALCKRYGAAEARRLIEDDLLLKARAAIRAADAAQRARRDRERAEAY